MSQVAKVLLILGGLALVGWVAYLALRPPPAAGDTRAWWERTFDAVAPNQAKFGYAGFGIELAF